MKYIEIKTEKDRKERERKIKKIVKRRDREIEEEGYEKDRVKLFSQVMI